MAFNEIIESQNKREFQETANALKNLEPTDSKHFGYKMVRLVGDTWEAVAQMAPAYKKHNLGKEISSLLIMLGDCTKGAVEAYGELHDIVSKKRHDDLYQEGLELRISKEFYTFVHLAFSLIDVIRIYKNEAIRLRNDPALEDKFQALLTVHYADKFNHLFIKEMRNNLSHVILHRPGWEINNNFETGAKSSGYFFNGKTLVMRGNWKNAELVAWLKQTDKIDCYTEMLKYFNATASFVTELLNLMSKNLSPAESHFQACLFIREGMQKKYSFGMIKQYVANKSDFDPYAYLDKYFSENEIRLIMRLPNHSKEQADFMIDLGDKWGVCDDATRKTIYELLRVKDA